MAYTKEDTEALEEQVARIRAKRNGGFNRDKLRTILNTIFILGAIIGLAIYFLQPESRINGLYIIGASMIVKVIEFVVRFF